MSTHDDAADAQRLALLGHTHGQRVERQTDAVTGMPVLAENERLAVFPVMQVPPVEEARECDGEGLEIPPFHISGYIDERGQFVDTSGRLVTMHGFSAEATPPVQAGTPVLHDGAIAGTVVGVDWGSGPDQPAVATLRIGDSTVTAQMGSPSGFNANGDRVEPAAFGAQPAERSARETAEEMDRRAVDNLIAAFTGEVRPRHYSMQYQEVGNQSEQGLLVSTPQAPPASNVIERLWTNAVADSMSVVSERETPAAPATPGFPDIRQILSDNVIRDMHTDEDRAFFSEIDRQLEAAREDDLSDVESDPETAPLTQWRDLAEELASRSEADDNATTLWQSISQDPTVMLEGMAPSSAGATAEERARQAVDILVAIQQLNEAAIASGNLFTAASAILALTQLAVGPASEKAQAPKAPHIWSAAHKAGRGAFVDAITTS